MPIFTMYSTYKIRQHSVKTSITTHSKNLINCVGYCFSATLRASGSLTYSRLRELLRTKLAQLGYDPDKFGIHSLCAGAATRAANAGIPDRLFKCHRRWKSKTAKDGYIEDSMENRLQVSNQLGL